MNTIDGNTLLVLVILAHAWVSRLQGPPKVLSIIGWVLNILVILALLALWWRR